MSSLFNNKIAVIALLALMLCIPLQMISYTIDERAQHRDQVTADLAATTARVATLGGEVLESTNVGAAIMVRDPDGQLLELIQARAR